ncbi:Ssb Single-stranded DNA-binding protein [uncultured Caudovirales phage]|uniref:Single-stranded DNA-binding protein n=1 Tax=uncultured Caudovirales phage TaxID=2100421 RepID=A0A6J5MGX7_9CAUD|nr:Ssb Single-stranded DNA-binding protein [uncultured Caudovirales phage]CAB4176844.1 Ssb Single-stranded DNA-binding protein [uncultured Caudovirales phage]CAB4190050.1 Ssb Single-stranded DNA-binding protein [uncultured Caudovirales phage]
MSGSVNKVLLIGRLGRDPEVRTMQSGDKVVSFGLATSESWRDKATGERKEKTEWVNVVIFNEHLTKVAEQYLRKGSSCFIEGQLQTRKYTDKDGNERTVTEVVLQRFRGELTLLGDGKRDDGDAPAEKPQTGPNRYAEIKGQTRPDYGDVEDKGIPF